MKILLLTPMIPPDKGGAAKAFTYLARIFARNKQVTEIVILSGHRQHLPLIQERGKTRVIRYLNYGGAAASVFFLTWNTLVIREFIKLFQPDMVIYHTIVLPFREYYGELFKNCRAAVYLYKTDLYPVRDFPELTGVVYLSENLRDKLIGEWKIPAGKLIYAPLLFPRPRKSGRLNNSRPMVGDYILLVGSIHPLKGVFELIQAFRILKQESKFKDLKLVLIGPGPRDITWDPDVIVMSGQVQAVIYRYIQHARVIVLPSYTEGLPRVALETLFFKKPLIISDVVAETRHLPPNQIIKNIEPREIAGKIQAILQGGEYSTEFPWERLEMKQGAKAWNQLLIKCLNSEGSKDLTTNSLPDIDLSPENPFFQKMLQAARDCHTAVQSAANISAIPAETQAWMPGLEKLWQLQVTKNLSPDNWLTLIEGIRKTTDLMNHEKKAYLKQILNQLASGWQIFPDPAIIRPLYLSLLPNTAEDYYFLGRFYFQAEQWEPAWAFLAEGLNFLPETVHLALYYQLSLFTGEIYIKRFQGEMSHRVKPYLQAMSRWADVLLKVIEEKHLVFLQGYMNLEFFLRGQLTAHARLSPDLNVKANMLLGSHMQQRSANGRIFYEQAATILCRRHKKNMKEIYQLASIYQRLGKNAHAIRLFRKISRLETDPGLQSGAFFHLGEIHSHRGEAQLARNYFSRCLELNPGHGKAREYFKKCEM